MRRKIVVKIQVKYFRKAFFSYRTEVTYNKNTLHLTEELMVYGIVP